MTETPTYTAVLLGPGSVGDGQTVELDYVDGALQEVVELDFEVAGERVQRTWTLADSKSTPVTYDFVGESDAQPSVKN